LISRIDVTLDPLARDRLVVVKAGAWGRGIGTELAGIYPDCRVASCESFLSAIAEVSSRPARAVIACIDSSMARISDAIGGLREAADAGTRLILCCTPEREPAALEALSGGADDYVLYPLDGREVDAAIGYVRDCESAAGSSAWPKSTTEELVELGALLAAIGDRPMVLLERAAGLLRAAMGARGAIVTALSGSARCGAASEAVLAAPLVGDGEIVGQISVMARTEGAYTAQDVNKFLHYATIIGRVLQASSEQKEWRRLAITDPSSGLGNRRHLHEQLERILARAGMERFPVTVLLFDIDNLKLYNDTHGHDAGDEVIRVTGELFRQHCREQDVVTRYGGDEFAVVFWDEEGPRVAGSKHPQSALLVLERFTAALGAHRILRPGAGEGGLTISGGLATFPWDGSTGEELLRKADQALLAAKRAGKNRIFLIGENG